MQYVTVFSQFWQGIDKQWHMVYYFFIHLSLSSLFTLFISLFSHPSSDIKPLHSFLFLSNITLSFFFSLFSSFTSIFVAVGLFFFFFFGVI